MEYGLIAILLAWSLYGVARWAKASGFALAALNGTLQQRGKVGGDIGPNFRSLHGRAGRREWFYSTAWCAFAIFLVVLVPVYGVLISIPWIFALLAVANRRLHDLNKPGWFVFLPAACMGVGLGIGGALFRMGFIKSPQPGFEAPLDGLATGAGILGVLAPMFFVIYLAVFPGTNGPNLYGEGDRKIRD